MVEAGLATWTGEGPRGASLIIRGQGRLLSDVTQIERLAAIQALFERLEAQETMLRLLELAERSEGVRIFIGAESGLFGNAGLSMVVAPARSEGGRIVGAIGVIGPTRINYGRIIPVVDYTARGDRGGCWVRIKENRSSLRRGGSFRNCRPRFTGS